MSTPRFHMRRCTAQNCGLRFPVQHGSPLGAQCPHCGGPTEFSDEPFETHPAHPPDRAPAPVGPPIEVLLDNVRSLNNVGSIFRTADGAGVRHLHLGGVTPTPDHPKLAKTALGAQRSVPWTHHRDSTAAAAQLRAQGLTLWAVEGGPGSVSLFELGPVDPEVPLVMVFGHEVSGIDPRIIRMSNRVIHLPMLGIKGSLNVSVALGIVAYTLRFTPH